MDEEVNLSAAERGDAESVSLSTTWSAGFNFSLHHAPIDSVLFLARRSFSERSTPCLGLSVRPDQVSWRSFVSPAAELAVSQWRTAHALPGRQAGRPPLSRRIVFTLHAVTTGCLFYHRGPLRSCFASLNPLLPSTAPAQIEARQSGSSASSSSARPAAFFSSCLDPRNCGNPDFSK